MRQDSWSPVFKMLIAYKEYKREFTYFIQFHKDLGKHLKG